jgi:hypothetical protein
VKSERAAIFVVRAWYEGDQFRARVGYSDDVVSEPMMEFVTANPDEIINVLGNWLHQLDSRNDQSWPGRGI